MTDLWLQVALLHPMTLYKDGQFAQMVVIGKKKKLYEVMTN
jgi:hypothetical protein